MPCPRPGCGANRWINAYPWLWFGPTGLALVRQGMQLPSQLSRSTLGDVLGGLLRARANGILAVTEDAGPRAGLAHVIHLVDGAPRAVSSDGAPLGQLLADAGAQASAWLNAAVARQAAGDERLLGELLCDLGLPREPVREAMRRQTRERLGSLFTLTRATLRFHAALFDDVAPRAWVRAARTAPALSPAEFLHGRPRARPRTVDARTEQATGNSPHDDRRHALRLLGLQDGADAAQIRSAFKQRVLATHPDHATSEADWLERTRVLARLTSAYQRLHASAG